MSRTYNRRAILQAKRDRQAVRDMAEQIVITVAVGSALVLFCATAILLAYSVGATL
jgi:hypothetical protein